MVNYHASVSKTGTRGWLESSVCWNQLLHVSFTPVLGSMGSDPGTTPFHTLSLYYQYGFNECVNFDYLNSLENRRKCHQLISIILVISFWDTMNTRNRRRHAYLWVNLTSLDQKPNRLNFDRQTTVFFLEPVRRIESLDRIVVSFLDCQTRQFVVILHFISVVGLVWGSIIFRRKQKQVLVS